MTISGILTIALALAPSDAVAQSLTLDYQQVVTRTIPGATAAFSLDPSRVAVTVRNGEVTLVGRGPGSTNVVVIIGDRSESFQVLVNEPPRIFFPGMANGNMHTAETGDYEVRYGSDPAILQGSLRLSRREGDRSSELSVGGAAPLADADGVPFSVPLAAYTIRTSGRDITVLDRVVSNSPLTVSRSNIRGLHVRAGPWQVHAGYSFFANFEHLLLPTTKESVAGVGYRYRPNARSSIRPNVYYFGGSQTGRTGLLGTLLYETVAGRDVKLTAEVGVSRAVGGALEVEVDRPSRRVWGKLRFAPPELPSLTTDQQSGRQVEGGWIARGSRLSVNANVSSRSYMQGTFGHTSNVAGLDVQSRFHGPWAIHGGLGYSAFDTVSRPGSRIQSVTLPVGAGFFHHNLGIDLSYQFSRETIRDLAGHLVRANVNGGARGFRLSAYAERQTHAPTAGHILSEIPWLQPLLDRLGLTATTPQQLAELLRTNAELSAYGYANSLTIDVTPIRSRLGLTARWSGSGSQLFASTLLNRDELIDRTARGAVHTVSYSQRLGAATHVFLSWSALCREHFFRSSACRPVVSVSLRQTLSSAPDSLLRGRGHIEGTVFQDDQSRGVYTPGLPTLAGVEVVLDGVRRTRTDGSGRFRFGSVPSGRHRVEARYATTEPIFFTTPSPAEIDAGARVDFGIGRALSSVRGIVRTDAGTGLSGLRVHITNADRHVTTNTAGDGTFAAQGLPAGIYSVTIEPGSVPDGYPVDTLATTHVAVEETSPGRATFELRPYRSVAGRVRVFDGETGQYRALAGTTVELQPLQRQSQTDANGFYVFRDLPSGDYAIVATHNGRKYKVAVKVPDGPAFVKDMDVAIVSTKGVADVAAAEIASTSDIPPASRNIRSGVASIDRTATHRSFSVQIAALVGPRRARAMVTELKQAGLPAYLVEPLPSDPDGGYRVRVGLYAKREEANKVASALEKSLGFPLWVTQTSRNSGATGHSR